MNLQSNYICKEAPETLSPKFMLYSTAYENMSNDERDKVFRAYAYNRRSGIYELVNPQILTQEIKDKLLHT